MSPEVHGYELLEKLYQSQRTVVYRGRHSESGAVHVLKQLREARPPTEALVRYRQEFEILDSLDGPHVIRAVDLVPHLHGLMLVLEDFGAEPLCEALSQGPLDLEVFFEIAIDVAEALGQIHASGVIHKDINPSNIVWNPSVPASSCPDEPSMPAVAA